MPRAVGLGCLRCGARYPLAHHASDCDACRSLAPSNLTVVYDESLRVRRPKPAGSIAGGLWRYGDVLPVEESDVVTLGEGGSPLHRLHAAGRRLGMTHLYAKDETRNPTWSFKDRLACLAVSAAKRMGAEVVVSSSSGNAGAAAAAYAAKAGLPCVIFTFKGTAGPMATQMRSYGATVVTVERKPDRWVLMEMAVRRFGWFPTSPFFGPAVGSNPFGVEGYKTLAYEIAEQMNWEVPDWCVLPVCYGDALVGMWKGFADMMAFGWTDRMPRMVAAEIYGSLGVALANGGDVLQDMPRAHDTVAVSIGATQGTFQALDIVRRSGGTAMSVGNAAMMEWQAQIAAGEGIYVEPASAAPIAAIESLRERNVIGQADTVVALFTASGLKDPATTARAQSDPIAVPADLEEAVRLLRAHQVFPTERASAPASEELA
ncbi:MAG TPA: pyridoxal-phosphate dependent enzyme [Sphingomicrobium sp.]|nr:pyridoxal-phosphate dependent enzyme [Sphingomicrobium sp.]